MVKRPNLAIVLAVLSIILGRAVVAANDNAPNSIWWSPELGLESLDQIDELLDKPIPPPRNFGVIKYEMKKVYINELIDEKTEELGDRETILETNEWTWERTNIRRERITNCRDLIKWTNLGYEPDGYDALGFFTWRSARCYALHSLKAAMPARTSHVRDFEFGDEAMNFLPAVVGEFWFCGRLKPFVEANRKGEQWSKFPHRVNGMDRPIYRLVVESKTEILVERLYTRDPEPKRTYSKTFIALYGRGDFDNDGYEDLLLRWQYFLEPFGPIPFRSKLYVVTRRQGDAVLRATDIVGGRPDRFSTCRERASIRESGRFE